MNRRKVTLGVAAVGVAAGLVGLGFLANPAGAGAPPSLPNTTPDALVQSMLTAAPPAMAGTVEMDNNLGLPIVPGLPRQLSNGTSDIRVWADGTDKVRVSLPSTESEQTYVDDGKTVYEWNSADRTVKEHSLQPMTRAVPNTGSLNPATAAREIMSALRTSSTVSVTGTDIVAGRSAYDLVLTPKPDQRTLLREVKVAVDAKTHIPLQVTVLGNNSTSPAIQIGFSSLNIGSQDPALFTFTPPAGSKIVNSDKKDAATIEVANQAAPRFVGSAWDTVVVARIPSQLSGTAASSPDAASTDPMSLVKRFGTPVSGPWGSGWAFNTSIGTALVTADGRIAVGFVPQQVLVQALGSAK